MKKRDQKLHLHRDTLLQLARPELEQKALRQVNAAVAAGMTSCIQPNCCGFEY